MNTDQQRDRMRKIVDDFQQYVATYSDQHEYVAYSDLTFINDMLYGIGLALDKDRYYSASGFDRWRKRLRDILLAVVPPKPTKP